MQILNLRKVFWGSNKMQMQYNIEDTTVESIMTSKLERLRKRLEAYG